MRKIVTLIVLGLLFASAACGAAGEPERVREAREDYRVLVFTKTTGFRHDSIPAGIDAIRALGRRHGFAVEATASAGRFTSRGLARYGAVIVLSTAGDPLSRAGQRRALERYIRRGGGFVGVHVASDTRGNWPWYERLAGARFARHAPGTARALVRIEDSKTAATRGLPPAWRRTDEWYDFRSNPRGRVHVLATVDESSYTGATMGADHSIA